MAQIGVEDVDAEKAKIAVERDERAAPAAKIAQQNRPPPGAPAPNGNEGNQPPQSGGQEQ